MMPTQAEIDAYRADGVVCLRGVIEPDWIERLREGVAADMAEPGPDVEIYTKDADPGLFFNDFDLWRHVPQMKAFALEGPCAAIAGALAGASTITFFYDQIFVKEPGTEGLTRWHQDQPYMAVDGEQLCSNWIPLDPITAETTLEFVRGSHRWGRWFAPFDSMLDGSPPSGHGVRALPGHRGRARGLRHRLMGAGAGGLHLLPGAGGASGPQQSDARHAPPHRHAPLARRRRALHPARPAGRVSQVPDRAPHRPALPRGPAVSGRLAGVSAFAYPRHLLGTPHGHEGAGDER